jgi:hypothetical protein
MFSNSQAGNRTPLDGALVGAQLAMHRAQLGAHRLHVAAHLADLQKRLVKVRRRRERFAARFILRHALVQHGDRRVAGSGPVGDHRGELAGEIGNLLVAPIGICGGRIVPPFCAAAIPIAAV